MEEEEEQAWRSLKRGILELEEEGGSWRESAKEPRGIIMTSIRNPEDTIGKHKDPTKEQDGVEDDKDIGGEREKTSPEMTLKALSNNQSGVRERIMMEVVARSGEGGRAPASVLRRL